MKGEISGVKVTTGAECRQQWAPQQHSRVTGDRSEERPLGKAFLDAGSSADSLEATVTARSSTRLMTRGVLYVHSAPSALCPHIEWAVAGVLDHEVRLEWTGQPAQNGTYRTEYSWSADAGSSAEIASALRGWGQLRFEVTEEPAGSSQGAVEGARYSYTPELGIFHAVTGLHGDIMVPEDRLKAAVVRSAVGEVTLLTEIDRLLGKPWDDELEPFRHAGDGAPVRWLHQVV